MCTANDRGRRLWSIRLSAHHREAKSVLEALVKGHNVHEEGAGSSKDRRGVRRLKEPRRLLHYGSHGACMIGRWARL